MAELHPLVQALLALIVACCAFAAWKGGAAERFGAAIVLINTLISTFSDLMFSNFRGIGSLTLDAVTAFSFLALTLVFGRSWLGVAMLIYALQFALHAFYLVTERSPHDVLHATINNVNYLAVNFCLVIGTIGAIRRRRAPPAA